MILIAEEWSKFRGKLDLFSSLFTCVEMKKVEGVIVTVLKQTYPTFHRQVPRLSTNQNIPLP